MHLSWNSSCSGLAFTRSCLVAGWCAVALVPACSPWQAPSIPPAVGLPVPPATWPPDPRLVVREERPPAASPPSASPPSAPPPSASPPLLAVEAPVDEPVRLRIDVEKPYKMGERAAAETREAYLADVRERRRWNDGGTGKLSGSLPGVEGHPDPRVIVKIEAEDVRGLHRAASLQVIARRHHWMPIVRCYRLGAYKDPQLRGWTKAQIAITRSGRVIQPKLIESELSDEAVSSCIVAQLTKLRFVRVRSRKKIASRAVVHMRVAPGDEPLPPPAQLIVPGEGKLLVAQMREPLSAAKASFETCYRAAFDYAPGLWGRIVVRFHLRADGTLDEAFEGGSRFPDKRVLQCVLRAARSLKFPQPTNGDLRFVVPLRFSSSRADTSMPSAK